MDEKTYFSHVLMQTQTCKNRVTEEDLSRERETGPQDMTRLRELVDIHVTIAFLAIIRTAVVVAMIIIATIIIAAIVYPSIVLTTVILAAVILTSIILSTILRAIKPLTSTLSSTRGSAVGATISSTIGASILEAIGLTRIRGAVSILPRRRLLLRGAACLLSPRSNQGNMEWLIIKRDHVIPLNSLQGVRHILKHDFGLTRGGAIRVSIQSSRFEWSDSLKQLGDVTLRNAGVEVRDDHLDSLPARISGDDAAMRRRASRGRRTDVGVAVHAIGGPLPLAALLADTGAAPAGIEFVGARFGGVLTGWVGRGCGRRAGGPVRWGYVLFRLETLAAKGLALLCALRALRGERFFHEIV